MTIIQMFRAVLALILIIVNTLFLAIPLFFFVLLRVIIKSPKADVKIARTLVVIAETWISINNLILATVSGIKWQIEGMDGLRRDDWYLVSCNHQTWADILVLQKISNRRIPFMKFFLKQELIKVPVLGQAWWALDFPFMKRHSREEIAKNPALRLEDLETTRKACEKFAYFPTTVSNFFEGTRFTQEKHDQQQSPYTHLLKPKSGGAAFALNAMSGHLRNMLDITIIYPPGTSRSLMAFLGGAIKTVHVIVDVKPIPEWASQGDYEGDDAFRNRFKAWVDDLWREKDALISKRLETF